MNVSVLVPTRDRCELLERCVTPLLADTAVSEVVVCDDGSTDRTVAVVSELRRSDARVRLVTTGGQGLPAALQAGLDVAHGDVVLWIDDDVEAGPGLASAHAAHHRRRQGLVVVGYMPVAPSMQTSPTARVYASDYERMCSQYESDPAGILRNLWGGNVSIRRSDARRIGFRSPGWQGSWRHADRDFGLRCLRAGLEGVFDRRLAARHHYRRDPSAIIHEARVKAAATVHLHERHAELIGPFSPEVVLAAPTVLRRSLLRLSVPRSTHPTVVRSLWLAARLSERAGRRDAAEALVRLLHRSVFAHHAIREWRRLHPEPRVTG